MIFLLLLVPAFAQRAELPDFTAGDQCLFCHRNDIGPAWSKNAHNLTIQPRGDGFAIHSRALRKTGYGRFSIQEKDGSWDPSKFNDRCAGCHTTAVNAKTGAFAEFSIDCFACHGVVDLEHSNDTALILLSKKHRTDAKTVASICGSCHLRGGTSKTTGLPYPTNFVPGDDLFAGFAYSDAPPADIHIYRSIEEMRSGAAAAGCLSCHSVHGASTQKHRRVLTSPACLDCHFETGPKKNVKPYPRSSALCEY